MHVSSLAWTLTLGAIVGLVLLDLMVVNRKPREASLRESAIASLVWTAIGLGFGLIVLWVYGGEPGGQYFAGYLLERTLSVDNVFVFVLILGYFAVPMALQHRALLWGVVIALVLRAVFIVLGDAMLERFEWTTFVFGAILVYSAISLARGGDEKVEPEQNPGLRLMRRIVPVSNDFEGHKLLTRLSGSGKRAATPLFAVLVVIGTTDLVFAVDSIPAIFSITEDVFIVFTANAFSLLGLRPLAFLLAGVMHRFVYLKPALAIVLGLVGAKMVAKGFHFDVNVWISLAVIGLILSGGVFLSLLRTHGNEPTEGPASEGEGAQQ